MAEVKICGLTRPEDARIAVDAGAGWLGVIFAGGPREITPDQAARVFEDVPERVRRVGVFGRQPPERIAGIVRAVGLDVVQLHGDPTPEEVRPLRQLAGVPIWAVIRVAEALPAGSEALAECADAVLLDTRVDRSLGGTGRAFDWAALRAPVEVLHVTIPIILAGGLTPENVAAAVATLRPDIVDVSSGVERSPGIKDPVRVRRFIAAARERD